MSALTGPAQTNIAVVHTLISADAVMETITILARAQAPSLALACALNTLPPALDLSRTIVNRAMTAKQDSSAASCQVAILKLA